MSLVVEKINANKPPPPNVNAKQGHLVPGAVNNNKDLDVEPPKEEQSFFGSFFSGKNKANKRVNLVNGRPGSPVRNFSASCTTQLIIKYLRRVVHQWHL